MPVAATAVIGLTTGSIGLTITLFKTTLELYSVFTSVASLGEDAQVFQAQLFIQEALFKRWGDGLGLTKGEVEDVDLRLKREGEGTLFQAAVVGLSSVKQVLSDVSSLQKSYGLECNDDLTSGGQLLVELHGMSLLDSKTVEADHKLRNDEAEKMQKRIGIMKKLKWVIKDKDKFAKLIERLTGLNNSLYTLIEPLDASILAKAVVGEIVRTLDLGRLRVLDAAARGTGNAADVARLAALRQRSIEIMQHPGDVRDMELPGRSKGLTWNDASRNVRRAIGSYLCEGDGTKQQEKSVLIEWKIIQSSLTGMEKARLDTATNSLAFFLSEKSNTEGLRSLTCLGITKPANHSAESIRYGLVYDYPGRSSDTTTAASLSDLLCESGKEVDLGNKFRIAQALAQAVHELQVANWFHKAIQSENVLIIPRKDTSKLPRQILPSSVYLAGYEFSRPGRLRDPTQPAGDVVRSVYAHPAYRDGNIRYHRLFDIYSLGVVLLEIGLWQLAADGIRQGQTALEVRDLLLESCEEELGPAMGRVYLNAVQCCLTGEFPVEGLDSVFDDQPNWLEMSPDELIALEEADEKINAELTASFFWKVVQPLRKLYA